MSDYEDEVSALAASIQLGYEVERDDPHIGYDMPSRDEIEWLAAWLVSEGWRRERPAAGHRGSFAT